MKKILAILIVVSLLAVTVSGLTTKNKADEKNININKEILTPTSTNTGAETSDIIIFNGREYYVPAFPDKTPEQLDKMIKNPKATISSDELPSSFSWKSFGGDWSTPAKDQGNCGSCWAFGAIGAMESAINIAKADPTFDRDLSEQYILSCLPSAGSCSGGWMSEAIDCIYRTDSQGNGINGCPLETCMPYTATDYVDCEDKCPDWATFNTPPETDDILFQVLDYGSTDITPSSESDWELLKTWIITYGPIVVDIYASGGWSNYWSSHHGSTDYYDGSETGTTNHAQVVYGWVDSSSVKNGGYWIMKNSWGTDFGYNGFNNLAYGCLMFGDRDVTWVTTPLWPEAEQGDQNNPLHPLKFVYSDWSTNPEYPKIGTQIQFTDESRGPVTLWNWDFNNDGQWDVSGTSLSAKNPKWTYNSEGNYQVTQEVWSEAGLKSTLTKNVEVKEIWPPVAISQPSYYGGKDNTVKFEGRYSHDVDGQITAYAWDFNGDGNTDTTEPYYTYTYPNENGEYKATLTVTDNEGAKDTTTIPVKIDKTVPPITNAIVGGLDQTGELWFNKDVVVELRTTDWSGVSKLNFKIDNSALFEKYCLGELEYSYAFYIRNPGLHPVQYYGTDVYGNIESTKTINIGIDENNPSMNVVLNGQKNTDGIYITPVEVTINANDVDSGVKIITYTIDNGNLEYYTSPFTINQGGAHTVDIIVVDKAGNTIEDTFTVTLAYGPSVPLINGPSSGKPNTEYTFYFTAYDEEGNQVAYYVDWGDGTNSGWSNYVNSGVTKSFTHTWTEGKAYTVKAKAKNIQGAESDWATQTISLPKAKNFIFGRFIDNFPMLQKLLSLPFFQKILEI